MHAAKLGVRRSVAQAPALAAVFALVVLVTALVAGIPRFLGLAEITSARDTLASASATDAALQVQLRLASDATAQTAAVDAVLQPLWAGTSAVIHRTLQSPPVSVLLPNGQESTVLLASYPSFDELARIVDGEWSVDDGGSVAMQADAAEALGLEVGDVIVLDAAELTIDATWLPVDAADSYWFSDAAVASGEAAGAFGPLVTSETALADLDVDPFVRWTIVPNAARVSSEQLPALATAASTTEARLRDDSAVTAGGLVFAGGLAQTVSTIDRSIASVRGVSPVPLVTTAVVGIIALAQLARLLAELRSAETLLLRARGRAPRQLALAAAAEAAVIVIPAVALGSLAAALLIPTGSLPQLGVTALAVTVVAIGTLVVAAVGAGRRTPRSATGATVGVVVLTVIAAIVSLWQFRLYGSPLVTTASGERQVDPLAVLAPSLGLIACGVVAVAAFTPLALLVAAAVSAERGIGRVLPARQVARRTGAFAVALLLVSLGAGVAVLASGYSATWTALNERAGELRNGADVRVQLATSGSVGSSPVSSIGFGETAAPVLVTTAELGDSTVAVVQLSGDELPEVMSSLSGAIAPADIAELVARDSQAVELDADSTLISIATTTTVVTAVEGAALTADQGATALTAWVSDAQGALARVALVDGTAALPAGVAPFSVLALDVRVTVGANAASYIITVDSIQTSTATGDTRDVATDLDWTVQSDAFPETDAVDIGGLGVTIASASAGPPLTARLMAPVNGPVPAVITQALADRVGLSEGDAISLRYSGSGLSLNAQIAGTVALLPATTTALGALVDLRAANEQLLRSSSSVPRPNQIWIAAADPAAAVSALSLPVGSTATTVDSDSGGALLRPVVTALWIGAAGVLALAAAALAAVAAALARTRRPEVTSLKALGFSDAQQARGRQRELLAVVIIGAVLGVLGGLLISALTVSDLARSAVLDAPRSLPSALQLDLAGLGTLLAGWGVLVAVILLVHGTRVRHQAATATGREAAQ